MVPDGWGGTAVTAKASHYDLVRIATASVCALSLAAIFIGAPSLGQQIDGMSLFVLAFPWTRIAFAAGVACSVLAVSFNAKRLLSQSRISEAASMWLYVISAVGNFAGTVWGVFASDYPLSVTKLGFFAGSLSAFGYLCLGLLIWSCVGLVKRRQTNGVAAR